MGTDETTTELGRILGGRLLTSVFQPVVALDDRSRVDARDGDPRWPVVAYEALTRGPRHSGLAAPEELFAAARLADRVGELDRLCRQLAVCGAGRVGLNRELPLFLNVEPSVTTADLLHELLAIETGSDGGDVEPRRLVLEITEREISARPAELLGLVDLARTHGVGLAVDDIGADPLSLAFLPFLRPDVVKLDLSLVQQRPTVAVAETVAAVNACAQRSGSLVLAEGIETPAQLELARAMGARLGQGFLFGRPGPLPLRASAPPAECALRMSTAFRREQADTPFQLVEGSPLLRRGPKRLLVEVARQLENQALALGQLGVVLATFQKAGRFGSQVRSRYAALGSTSAFVAAFGEDLEARPVEGVRGIALAPDDDLVSEWDVAVVGPHFAAALVARDVGDTGPDAERRFDYFVTYDWALASDIACTLMRRVAPLPPTPRSPMNAGRAAAMSRAAQVPPDSLPELLERALASSTNGICIADAELPDQPIIYVNSAFERITGYSAAQVLGQNCRILQGPSTDVDAVRQIGSQLRRAQEVKATLVNHRPDGTPFWNEIQISPVHDGAGRLTHFLGLQNDVTDRVRAQAQVAHLAFSDPLTGLANRAALRAHLDSELIRAARTGTSLAVLFCDLDGFKSVNDQHGHTAGDEVLVNVAGRLSHAIRADDLLARYGGDEFVAVLSGLHDDVDTAVNALRRQLQRAVAGPLTVKGHEIRLRTSIGASVYPQEASNPEELLRLADADMYRQKQAGAAPSGAPARARRDGRAETTPRV